MAFSWNKIKAPFRHFDRQTVEEVMKAVDIDAETISGAARAAYPARVMDYETFSTMSDGVEYFAHAMMIELEHKDLTEGIPLATAMIVAAHLKGVEFEGKEPYIPFITYYDALIWMEGTHEKAWQLYLAKNKK